MTPGGGPRAETRRLPVFGVFAEALALMARHSGRLLGWSVYPGAAGVAMAGAAFVPLSFPAAIALGLILAASTFMASCAFSVRVHRLILLPLHPSRPFPALFLDGLTWRYAGETTCVALAALFPAALGVAGAVLLGEALELSPGWLFVLEALLPLAASQALLAGWQLIGLTSVSVRDALRVAAKPSPAEGFRWRLAGAALLNCGFAVGVSLFAGWLVGTAFPDQDLAPLELFTLAVGLPVQLAFFSCLQAACFRRLVPEASPAA